MQCKLTLEERLEIYKQIAYKLNQESIFKIDKNYKNSNISKSQNSKNSDNIFIRRDVIMMLKLNISELDTNPKFKGLMPIDNVNYKLLAEDIKENGIQAPIIVWKLGNQNVIVDGHNRFEIAQKLNINEVLVTYKEFEDEDDVIEYILEKPQSCRIPSKEHKNYMSGTYYNKVKSGHGGKRFKKTFFCYNENNEIEEIKTSQEDKKGVKACVWVGEKFGMNGRTITTNARYATEINKIAEVRSTLKSKILYSNLFATTRPKVRPISQREVTYLSDHLNLIKAEFTDEQIIQQMRQEMKSQVASTPTPTEKVQEYLRKAIAEASEATIDIEAEFKQIQETYKQTKSQTEAQNQNNSEASGNNAHQSIA